MLVINRSIRQTLNVGDDITIAVLGVDKNTGNVRLGIEAPKHIKIHRDDIVNTLPPKIKAEPGSHEYEREQQRRAVLTMNKGGNHA